MRSNWTYPKWRRHCSVFVWHTTSIHESSTVAVCLVGYIVVVVVFLVVYFIFNLLKQTKFSFFYYDSNDDVIFHKWVNFVWKHIFISLTCFETESLSSVAMRNSTTWTNIYMFLSSYQTSLLDGLLSDCLPGMIFWLQWLLCQLINWSSFFQMNKIRTNTENTVNRVWLEKILGSR